MSVTARRKRDEPPTLEQQLADLQHKIEQTRLRVTVVYDGASIHREGLQSVKTDFKAMRNRLLAIK